MSQPSRVAATGYRRRGAVGSIAPFIAIVAVGLLLLGGLVVDGARQLDARGRATAYAEEAARAGVQRILLNYGDTKIDAALAETAVGDYCEAAQSTDATLTDCVVDDIEVWSDSPDNPVSVTVHTEVVIEPLLLSMIGVGELDASAQASATPQQGINQPQEEYSLPPGSLNPSIIDPSLTTGTPPDTTPTVPPPTVPNCDAFDQTPLPPCGPPVCDDDPMNLVPVCVEETEPPEPPETTPPETTPPETTPPGPPGTEPNCDREPGGLPDCEPPTCDFKPRTPLQQCVPAEPARQAAGRVSR